MAVAVIQGQSGAGFLNLAPLPIIARHPAMSDQATHLMRLRSWLECAEEPRTDWERRYLSNLQHRLRETAADLIAAGC